ncbi:hypothetical protein [Desulfopila sp. IMCC35006]|nr:hypothetical protein [Desulfopila sp. IMCC35006]
MKAKDCSTAAGFFLAANSTADLSIIRSFTREDCFATSCWFSLVQAIL